MIRKNADRNGINYPLPNLGKLTIGTLKYFARTDNKDAYEEYYKTEDRIMTPNEFYEKFGESLSLIEDDNAPTPYQQYLNEIFTVETPLYETTNINQRFILQKDEFKKNTPTTKAIKKSLKKWYTKDDCKVNAIKSSYGSGKTMTLDYVIEKYEPKTVLFITYRQTLSYNFFGNFEKHNVGCYLTGDYKSDRLICQFESLHKLLQFNHFTGKNTVPEYDLIVFDECESNLAHTDSNTINNKDKSFKIMEAIMLKAKKVIALDGDFGNRSYEFLKHINNDADFKVIKNEYVPVRKHWSFTNSKAGFDEKIENDLAVGYKVFIVDMSSSNALDYYKNLKDKYKVLLHYSKADDSEKEKLRKVNEYWIQYDCVIITPTVEAGVDFDVKHFDKQYIILSTGSTSQRGLNQMTSRVRQFTDNNVDVYLNGLPYKELVTLQSKEEVDVMFDKQVLKGGLNLDTDDDKPEDLFVTINKYNYWENVHKSPAYFVPYLIKLLGGKGHTFSFDDTQHKKQKNKSSTKEAILNAKDITKAESVMLMRKQEKNLATENEKYALEKYFYKVNWELNELSEDTFKRIYRKTHIMYNNKAINNQPLRSYESIDREYLDIDLTIKKRKLEVVNQLLQVLQFKDEDNEFTNNCLSKEALESVMTTAQKKCGLFTDPTVLTLFGFAKSKLETNKALLGFCNSALANYGIEIKCIQTNKKDKKGNKINSYKLVQDKIMKEVNELLTANEYYEKYADTIDYDEYNHPDATTPYQQYLLKKKMMVYF